MFWIVTQFRCDKNTSAKLASLYLFLGTEMFRVYWQGLAIVI